MKKLCKKLIVLALSVITVCSSAVLTVYADPDDVTTSYNDTTVSDGGTSEIPPVEPEPYVPPVVDPVPSVVEPEPYSYDDTPSIPDTPSYDDGQNYTSELQPYDNPQEIPQENPEPNYDADYYNNMYGGNVISYDMNTEFNDDYQNAIVDNYNPGMTFDQFEMATDYQSATVSVDKTVDMFTSNGSINQQNLSKKDWQEISLSFDKGNMDTSGDFSFIKNNTSDKDSNLSILFLIVGILFICTAVFIVLYMIISSARRTSKEKISSDNDKTTK